MLTVFWLCVWIGCVLIVAAVHQHFAHKCSDIRTQIQRENDDRIEAARRRNARDRGF